MQDGLRDGEHIRHQIQDRFREVLEAQTVSWIEVGGSIAERTTACVAALD